MKTIEIFDNKYYFINKTALWKRILVKIIWLGGWMSCDWNKKGEMNRVFKITKRNWNDPLPITLFDKITFQPFGVYVEFKRTFFVWTWKRNKAYLSNNGTPQNATVWYWGAPSEILKSVQTPPEIEGK
jgi:hypothetical protein